MHQFYDHFSFCVDKSLSIGSSCNSCKTMWFLLSYNHKYLYTLIISNNKIRGILASLSAIKYLELLSQATISVFITLIITETVYQIIFLIQSLSIDLYWNFRTCNLEQSWLSHSLLGFQYYLPNARFYSLSNMIIPTYSGGQCLQTMYLILENILGIKSK